MFITLPSVEISEESMGSGEFGGLWLCHLLAYSFLWLNLIKLSHTPHFLEHYEDQD